MDWDTHDLRELWENARESHDAKSGYFAVESTVMICVVAELFFDAGSAEYIGPATEGDTPGMASSLSVFYAEDPKAIFDKALVMLAILLRQE